MKACFCGMAVGALALFSAFPAQGDMGDLLRRFPNPNTGGSSFPYAVAGEGSLVAGSSYWDSKVYLFNAQTGALQRTLTSPGNSGEFGRSLDILGNLLLVGADRTYASGANSQGAAFLYDAGSGQLLHSFWSPRSGQDSRVGYSVAMVGDKVLLGAWGVNNESGEAYLFNATSGALLSTLMPPGNLYGRFGYSVAAMGKDALVLSQGNTPGAYRFDCGTGQLLTTYVAPDGVPTFDSIAAVGDKVLIGSSSANGGKGEAYIYNRDTGSLLSRLANPNQTNAFLFGERVAGVGNVAVVGCRNDSAVYYDSGTVHLFDSDTGQLLYSIANPDPRQYAFFGANLADMGNNLLVGGGSGCTNEYLFQITPEPATLCLLGLGGLALLRRKRASQGKR
ncbi:MAG: PEP-CTERM sorting domain-containing protein [Planctomycetes bacterium]|nr:PEP-CTERM sorting domain-containing protein [Planctomycetota bacterium]